jgi:predicted nucleic-acid-binding Zn-ribbon protein
MAHECPDCGSDNELIALIASKLGIPAHLLEECRRCSYSSFVQDSANYQADTPREEPSHE